MVVWSAWSKRDLYAAESNGALQTVAANKTEFILILPCHSAQLQSANHVLTAEAFELQVGDLFQGERSLPR